jgi:RHS repeat-associated protein
MRFQHSADGAGYKWVAIPTTWVLCILLVSFSCRPGAAQPAATTITKTYTYNDDGALTSVTTQVDDEPATVSYLTWDNFVPDTQDPTTGQIAAGNGNLVGVGPAPGDLSAHYTFDGQDRLIGYSDDRGSVFYTYHPTWLMASATKGSGDSIHFYYGGGTPARVATIEHDSSGAMASLLGPICSVTDGTQKILMSPRKDVAGVFDPDQGTFTPYSYDAWGGDDLLDQSEQEPTEDEYDLTDNPFRYAGEYRDPNWGGYYLRARWYDPQLRTFVSRDPAVNLNRFGYTDGNPIARHDPTGSSHNAWNKHVRNPVDRLMARLDKHAVDRILVSPLLGPIALAADPVGFWHGLGPNTPLRLLSLTGIVGSEVLTGFLLSDASHIASFVVEVSVNAGVGAASSYVAASSHGFHRLNRRLFFNGLQYTAGGIFEYQFVFGAGYRPFNLDLDDVITKWKSEPLGGGKGEASSALVFRFKQDGSFTGSSGKGFAFLRGTNPLFDAFGTGWYHEGMLALGRDEHIWITEVTSDGLRTREGFLTGDLKKSLVRELRNSKSEFRLVGKFRENTVNDVFLRNPRGIAPLRGPDGIYVRDSQIENLLLGGSNPYSLFSRNCQQHAGDVLRALGDPG